MLHELQVPPERIRLISIGEIRDLALAPHPLHRYDGRGPDVSPDVGRVALTETGRRVTAWELDHAALNGPDRWIGGVHFHPGGLNWRYDATSEGTEMGLRGANLIPGRPELRNDGVEVGLTD